MEVPGPVAFIIVAGTLYFVWRFYRRKIARINAMGPIPREIPTSGFEIPILAAFTGIRKLPRQTNVAWNNAFPALTLYPERLDCRVLKNWAIGYASIEKIDIWDTLWTRNLTIYVRGREDTFTANLLNRQNLTRTLLFLQTRGAPLTSRAKAFIAENPT